MSGRAEGVRIRLMRAGDLEQAMEIERGLKDAPHWTPAAWQAVFDPERLPLRIAVVAEEEEGRSVQGFAVASVTAAQAELESVGVTAAWQRRGLARAMLGILTAELWRNGVEEIFLEVRASNRAARSFYHTAGFAETGRRARYYADPEEDAVIMRLSPE